MPQRTYYGTFEIFNDDFKGVGGLGDSDTVTPMADESDASYVYNDPVGTCQLNLEVPITGLPTNAVIRGITFTCRCDGEPDPGGGSPSSADLSISALNDFGLQVASGTFTDWSAGITDCTATYEREYGGDTLDPSTLDEMAVAMSWTYTVTGSVGVRMYNLVVVVDYFTPGLGMML